METFERLINLFNVLRDIYKLVQKIEDKWYTVSYINHQFGILYYDLGLERKIFDELNYQSKDKLLNIIIYTEKDFSIIDLEDTKKYALFDLCKKRLVVTDNKELGLSVYIRKETDTLTNLINSVSVKNIILDDQFIKDKLQYILTTKDFNIHDLEIKSLFINYYNNFINSISDKSILAKTIIVINNELDNNNKYLNRYFPLFGYYISFNIYDDVCNSSNYLPEQLFTDLNKLKKDIVKLFLKYDIIDNCDYLNMHVYKNINDMNNCYINFEINFDFKDILEMILLIDIIKVIQKI